MLYNNNCTRPARTERPITASLIPYAAAAFFFLPVEVGSEELLVPVPDDPTPLFASAVVLQVKVPWITLFFMLWKVVQSIVAVD